MESNEALEDNKHEAKEKLLNRSLSTPARSPVIQIRTPGRKTLHRNESIAMKRFDLSPDDLSLFQAAREGRLITLKHCKESGDSLDERDVNGFAAIHHATRANKVEAIRFLLDSGVDVNTTGGANQLTSLHISVRFNCLEATKFLLSRGASSNAKSTDGTTPLHFAARHGDKDVCQLLLVDKHININVPDNSGVTAFHCACSSGNVELCEFFLEQGADILVVTAEKMDSLHIAALHGHSEIVEKLIDAAGEKDAKIEDFVNSYNADHNTALHMACKRGHVETVKLLLQNNADLDSRNDIVSNTPLHVAAQAGQVNIVKVLVVSGASVSSMNALRRLPIHLAAIFGHWEVIQCLLDNGSPIDPQDVTSLTPLLSAVSAGRLLVAERLIQLGADASLRNDVLQTCVHIAVQNKKVDMLLLLVDTIGAEILDIGDKDLRLPLHYCAYGGQYQMLQSILSRSTDPHPKDIVDKTPLHMAAESGNIDCVKVLAETGPLHVNDHDDTNTTPLHEAAKKGNRDVCKYLLRVGADITAKDSNRWTALHHAANSGHLGTVKILLRAKTMGLTQTIDEQDSDGNTPLIIAAKNGHIEIVRLLISQNADITVRNEQRMTCLDEAVQNNKLIVVMEMVKSERWYEVVRHRPQDQKYPMENLIKEMPQAAKEVLDRCIKISNLPPDDPEYSIQCDFRLLDSWKGDGDILRKEKAHHFFAPTVMIKNERENLLSHPVVRSFLSLKWRRLGRPLTNVSLLLYMVYVFLYTSFVVERRSMVKLYSPGDNRTATENANFLKNTRKSMALAVLITILIVLLCVKEIFQMIFQGFKYFMNGMNYLEWCSYSLVFAFMIPHITLADPFHGTGAMWPLGASAILVMYACLILSLRCVGAVGIYISMFIEILKTMWKVTAMFSLFIFSFGLVFFTLLKEQESFRTLGWTFVKTIMMMMGDLDFDGIITDQLRSRNSKSGAPLVPAPEFTSCIMILFSFVMVVLFMNLLIGLAVGDIDSIQKNASFKKKVMQVEMIVEIDERYPKRLSGMVGIKQVMVFKPNQRKPGFAYWLFDKLYNIDTSIFTKDYSSDKEDDLTTELKEQKARTLSLQKSLDEQRKIIVSISTELQKLTGSSSPFVLRTGPFDNIDASTSNQSLDGGTTPGGIALALPPSLL